jgi:hypothetical protein
VSSGQDYTSRNAGRSRRTDIKQPQVDAVDARIVEDVLKEFLC